MKLNYKIAVPIFLLLVIIVIFINVSKKSMPHEEQINGPEIDQFLAERGIPKYIMDELPTNQKQFIFHTLAVPAVFEHYNLKLYEIVGSDLLLLPNDTENSDLTLSLMVFKTDQDIYFFYPSFIWSETLDISNDVFAWVLEPGWEAMTETRLYLWNQSHDQVYEEEKSLGPARAAANGYLYLMPEAIKKDIYEAHGYFNGEKKDALAENKLTLFYNHDLSSNANYLLDFTGNKIEFSITEDISIFVQEYFDF